ncbi:hypothetical protein FIBSPDRAFT_876304 [Athelia psychrophila]|uniref:Uncharacterized protein n=1 Tax=Athelia psychrophila TaxID=1759441 RepID=A0A167WZ55_9AGAM|nr:hypothetical protein FIBSPDRAFT_876304 [Fibularhizoctonia sp. CBS 109695]
MQPKCSTSFARAGPFRAPSPRLPCAAFRTVDGCQLWLAHLLLPRKSLTQFTLAKDLSDYFARRGVWI